jgi:hypothetical protein
VRAAVAARAHLGLRLLGLLLLGIRGRSLRNFVGHGALRPSDFPVSNARPKRAPSAAQPSRSPARHGGPAYATPRPRRAPPNACTHRALGAMPRAARVCLLGPVAAGVAARASARGGGGRARRTHRGQSLSCFAKPTVRRTFRALTPADGGSREICKGTRAREAGRAGSVRPPEVGPGAAASPDGEGGENASCGGSAARHEERAHDGHRSGKG